MPDSDWDILILAHLDEALDEEGQEKFNALMISSPEARERFWQLAEIHTLSREVFRTEPAKTAPPAVRWHWSGGRRQWQPLARAAMGILLGVLGTSIVWSYGLPLLTKHILPLVQPGFEGSQAIGQKETPQKIPLLTGEWIGAGELVGARGIIKPAEGQQMLRFMLPEPGASNAPVEGMVRGAGVMQLVDVRPWRAELADGMTRVEWSAAFNGMNAPAEIHTSYRISMRAFVSDEGKAEASQSHAPEQQSLMKNDMIEVAQEMSWSQANKDPSRWQTLFGSMTLPPQTDFLLIELRAFHNDTSGTPKAAKDILEFADDVRLSLVAPPRPSAPASPQPSP